MQSDRKQIEGGTAGSAYGVMFRGCAVVLVGIALGVSLVLFVSYTFAHSNDGRWARLVNSVLGRSTTVDISSPAVIDRIRKLSRLETVVYSLDKIVEGERKSLVLPNFLAGDKLLLIAHGEVTAGVDLSQLSSSDVHMSGKSIRIHLPTAQLLSVRLDNERTKVYSRDTGLLVTADPNLESQVRQAAEEQIGQAAISDGILAKAHANAVASVSALLFGLGFQAVDVS